MSAGYPGTFPGALTTGYRNIGGVQKQRTGTAGYPGVFPGGLTTGYETIGAVQRDDAFTTIVSQVVESAWHDAAAVSQVAESAWNVATTVTQSVESAWNLAATVGQVAESAWDGRVPVSQSVESAWSGAATVSGVVESAWSAGGQVWGSVEFAWDILPAAEVGAQDGMYFDVGVMVDALQEVTERYRFRASGDQVQVRVVNEGGQVRIKRTRLGPGSSAQRSGPHAT